MTSNSENQAPAANGESRRLVARSWTQRVSRRAALLALGGLLVFDLLFYLSAVYPLGAREQEQQLRMATLESQIEARKRQIGELEVIVGKVGKARTEGDELLEEITLERRTTFSTLLAELQQAAADSGVEARESSFEVERVDGAETYGMVHIAANYRARYANLVQFLNRLDRSEKFLIIGSLGATPRADSDELQVTLRFDTFVRGL